MLGLDHHAVKANSFNLNNSLCVELIDVFSQGFANRAEFCRIHYRGNHPGEEDMWCWVVVMGFDASNGITS